MRVLLDNCVPLRMAKHLKGHKAEHVARVGMAELSNGVLLKAAMENGFEVLVTVDRNLARQQNIGELPIPVIVIFAVSNTERALLEWLPEVMSLLNQSLQKRVYLVGAV